MALFRTMQRLIPWFIGLFLVAQFAGIVPRVPYAKPGAAVVAVQLLKHHQHGHDHADHSKTQRHHPDDQSGNNPDECCALHLLTAVVALPVTSVPAELVGERLPEMSAASVASADPNHLYRPPRSLLSL